MLLRCEFVDYDCLRKYQTSCIEEKTISAVKFKRTEKNLKKIEIETPPHKPQFSHISLPIFVNVIGISDRDNCVSAEDQMKHRPFDKIDLDVDKFMKDYLEKIKVKGSVDKEDEDTTDLKFIDTKVIKSVIEHIASDAVFCDYFGEVVKILKQEPNPLYSQVTFNFNERDQQITEAIREQIVRPKRSEVSEVFGEILVDSLHNTFHLEPNRPKIEVDPKKNDEFM